MRDMLAQEEREAQHEVDNELETGQMKLRDLMKRLTENTENMIKAREDINSLLSQSQTLAFLQVRWTLSQTDEVGDGERVMSEGLAWRQTRESCLNIECTWNLCLLGLFNRPLFMHYWDNMSEAEREIDLYVIWVHAMFQPPKTKHK